MNEDFPQTLVEAIRYFSNPQTAFDFMVKLREERARKLRQNSPLRRTGK
jgi:hypothetical protein